MSTTYYVACVDCKSLCHLGNYYLVPSIDEYYDIQDDIREHEASTSHYTGNTLYLLTFMLKHPAHRLVLANSDGMDALLPEGWYETYTREVGFNYGL